MLVVSAARTTAKGTVGPLKLTLGYGLAGSMDAEVDLHVIASTRPTARVVDRTVLDGVQGRDVVVDVLAGAFNPFPDSALTVVGATVETPGSGVATSTSSTVTVRPDAAFVGQMVTRFRVADSTGDPAREVEGRVTVVVRGRPDAPKAPRVVESRDATVVLAWDAPDNRGEPITGYRVTAISAAGQLVRACVSTTCTIDNLTNDTEYTFTVAAQNAVDWSDPSPASAPARPDAVPDAPDAPSLTFGDQAITAAWSTPTSAGSAVQRYDVEITPAPRTGPATNSTSGTTATFGALDNGTAYTVRVRAYNRLTTAGPWSASSTAMRPAGVPGAPVVSAQRVEDPLGGQITVAWTVPSGNGDDGLTYGLVISGGPGSGTAVLTDPAATSYAFRGAANGVAYTFAVRATNKAGTGAAGTVVSSTFGVPGAVAVPTATADPGQGAVRVDWVAPASDGGSPVTHYLVQTVGGAQVDVPSDPTTTTITGLTGGTTYAFSVQACNVAGCSGAWSPSAWATATTAPGAATGVTLADPALDGQNRPTSIAASWAAPADWGGGPVKQYRYRFYVAGQGYLTDWTSTSDTSAKTDLNGSWFAAVGSGTTEVRIEVVTSNGDARGPVAQTSRSFSRAREPGLVTGLVLTSPAGSNRVTATWDELSPSENGGLAVSYEVRFQDPSGWTGWTTCPSPGGSVATCSGTSAWIALASVPVGGAQVTVEVRASDAVGTGPTATATMLVPAP
ncbi:fibronectin type III domain-containing protein [Cellulomonas sp. WB94]|uniref:fibronectin type III domain-containing protein n=1 Tax=Cellulomonas sp. WB94 TaxID=2173174 RepID=UPI001F5B3745|nr:fibronectin type III domain-containing protein [Cellulomonas sp. WB94]